MYSCSYAASAGRAVLEMVQVDWEPLSHTELDQRLDQAVEEILEAELIEKARASVGPAAQLGSGPSLPLEPNAEGAPLSQRPELPASPESLQPAEDDGTIKLVTDLLQSSDWSHRRGRLAGRARLSLRHTVLLSLTLLRKRLSYRSVSSRFHVEKGNIHRIFFSFCERVNALAQQLIYWPTGQEAEESLEFLSGTESLENSGIPKVFGILGNTRIPIRLPIGHQQMEGGVLEAKRLKREVHPDSWLNLELGSCLVARTGYPLSGQILTPYPSPSSSRECLYNQLLQAHLRLFDETVALLKARFQRLKYLDMGNFERAQAVVLTACILHNAFLQAGDRQRAPDATQEEPREEEGPGEVEEEGQRRRDAVADLLFTEMEAGRLKCVWDGGGDLGCDFC
ncbi:hypothetical protein GJAV_G00214010 [Gymnothorax javanicus]|nr:hypothetical protein GJAV_G00214010 [Gymnothorax javanicus]